MARNRSFLAKSVAVAAVLAWCNLLFALQAGVNIDVHQDIPCDLQMQNCPNDFHVEGLICSNGGPPMLMDHVDGMFSPPNGNFSYSIIPAGLPDPCWYKFTADWWLVPPASVQGIPYCTVAHMGLLFDVVASNVIVDLHGWWTRDGKPVGEIRQLPNGGFIPMLGFDVRPSTGSGQVLRIANGNVIQPPAPTPPIPVEVLKLDVVAFPAATPPDFRELREGGAQATYPWVPVKDGAGNPIDPTNPVLMAPDSFFDVFLEMAVPGNASPATPVVIPPGGFLVARQRIAFTNNAGQREERWEWEIHGAQAAEACCFPDGSCQEKPPSDCMQAGGTPQGAGSTCAQTVCQALGACCYGTTAPTCMVTDQITCEQQFMGIWRGPGTTCADADGDGVADVCEEQKEACCKPDGTCSMELPGVCRQYGGIPEGPGSTCQGDLNGNGIDDGCENLPIYLDWGDAPDQPYPTLAANNGARHTIVPGMFLGNLIDRDPDGQPDPNAKGDDLAGLPDEDGVQFLNQLARGRTVQVQVTASMQGRLNAWIDFDRNGSWAEPADQIFTNVALGVGPNVLTFVVPGNASLGNTFARFRYNSQGGLSFTGPAMDGEVEDYPVVIRPAQLLRRHIFYNNCYYDGNKPIIDALPLIGVNNDDGDAIDPSKSPLMPGMGQATFSNWTGYDKGINGLIYDVFCPSRTPVIADFTFSNIGKAGIGPGVFVTPTAFVVQTTTDPDVTRCVFTFIEVKNTWLEITVGTGFGLPAADQHWWGNAVGDTGRGNTPPYIMVNATDEIAARNNMVLWPSHVPVDCPYDINKDSYVNATDQIVIRNNIIPNPFNTVRMITR